MRNISKTALLMLLLASAGLSFAASYPGQVPVTGETGGAAGSDSGVSWPENRFVSGRGATENCVTDKLTGLMWAKDANLFGEKTYSDALSVVTEMNNNSSATGYNLCGFKNWRLPNLTELKSLVNYSQINQALWLNNSPQPFTNVQARLYWSSTISAPSSPYAWYVNFEDGHVDAIVTYYDNYVWPVRRVK